MTTFYILLNREPLPPLGIIQQAFQSIDLALLNLERLPQIANLFFERFNFEIFSYNELIQRGGARDSWGPSFSSGPFVFKSAGDGSGLRRPVAASAAPREASHCCMRT